MYTTLGVVEVLPAIHNLRTNSPLAGIARRRIGGKTLLEWVVRRTADAHWVDQVVVIGPTDALTSSLVALAPPDVRVFQSSAADALGRLADLVRQIPCRALVRLSVSTPFIDPILLDRLIADNSAAPDPIDNDIDYSSFCLSDGRPVLRTKVGVFAEWFRTTAIGQADRMARTPGERGDPGGWMSAHPEIFAVKWLPAPAKLDRDDLRLAINDEDDWEHVQEILDALGPESLDWQYITALLDRHPQICQRMAELNRAEAYAT